MKLNIVAISLLLSIISFNVDAMGTRTIESKSPEKPVPNVIGNDLIIKKTPDVNDKKTYTFASPYSAYLSSRIARTNYDYNKAFDSSYEIFKHDGERAGLYDQTLKMAIVTGNIDKSIELAKLEDDKKGFKDENGFAKIILLAEKIKKAGQKDIIKFYKESRKDMNILVSALTGVWINAIDGKGYEENIKAIAALKDQPLFFGIYNHQMALLAKYYKKDKQINYHLDEAFTKYNVFSQRTIILLADYFKDSAEKSKIVKRIDEFLTGQNDLSLSMLSSQLKHNDSIKNYQFNLDAKTGISEAFMNIGLIYAREQDVETSLAYLQLAHYLNPNDVMILMTIAEVYESVEATDKAIAFYDKAREIENSPYEDLVILRQSYLLSSNKEYDLAVSRLKSIPEEKYDIADFDIALGDIQRDQKNLSEASEYYTKALEKLIKRKASNEELWRVYYARGVSYEQNQEWEKAEKDLLKAYDLAPNQPSLLNYLGYSWVDRNENLDKALAMLKKAVKLRPSDAYITDSLGWAYYKIGSFDKAVIYLEKAVDLMPGDPTVNEHLGDAYWQVGRKTEAEFQWKHALAFNPEQKQKEEIEQKIANGLEHSSQTTNNSDYAQNKE